jgi:hypothetical protein
MRSIHSTRRALRAAVVAGCLGSLTLIVAAGCRDQMPPAVE